ncbi:MAG: LUD domain-containing protein [Anaerolineales bacterium]
MSNIFRARIRASLADENLQAALDANAERRIKVRQEAFASLADPQALRSRAHAIRADVIGHLDDYLDQFTNQAIINGMIVHRADNAEQAINIVLEIALRQGAKLIAKSKTMVSEEIKLNHALSTHGLEVIETDLGEYIVQLRGEPPSHIITPAVHLRRADVGKLFQEKLGLPYTEDISIMTDAARQKLRQVFLNADIGISGVNFGVAETGTLCLVTNEGNGRMVTTIPRTHIALMGIERIVPTLKDLSLMLSLLPRSATGQKLSVYTSLLNSPRRQEDPDGPGERHIILVDNGRRATQASDLREILYCIRCGACLNACPVFREIGGHAYVNLEGKSSPYPGPMGSVVSPALFGQLEYGHLARASSLCGACREACPVDIDLPQLLLKVRAGIRAGKDHENVRPNAPKPLGLGLGLFTLAATSPVRFTAAQRLAGLFGSLATILSKGDGWIRLPNFSGWGDSKDFPRPKGETFRARYNKRDQRTMGKDSPSDLPQKTQMAHMVNREKSSIPTLAGIERFASELEGLGGNFIACTFDEVPLKILEILETHGIDQLLVWNTPYLPASLLERIATTGIHLSKPSAETLDTSCLVRAGLTGASAGIADTGSIVLVGGSGRPLSASLLPEIHIALLWEKDIVENLEQALQNEDVKKSPASVIISGPSRTADIEMTLTIGLHGPCELVVICVIDKG